MVGKCKWCGKPFTKTHNRQMYCSNYCRKNARREQQAEYSRTYRKKYKGMLPDATLYGLGSGRLGSHTCYNWRKEYKKIQNEYVFLNIKPKRGELKT